jgi:methylmalonyl-CoA/ethylmalonyl-CoA epimerase
VAIEGVDHIGVLVDDLAEARRFASETLGLEVEREAEMPPLGLEAVFFRCGPVLIELFELVDPSSPFRPLDPGARARIDHIAVRVDDIRATVAQLGAEGVGWQDVGTGSGAEPEPLALGGNLNAWSAPDTSDGVTYQLIEKGAG